MCSYKTEIREFPHPRSIEHIKSLAKVRGAMVGLEFVEAFYLVKGIEY